MYNCIWLSWRIRGTTAARVLQSAFGYARAGIILRGRVYLRYRSLAVRVDDVGRTACGISALRFVLVEQNGGLFFFPPGIDFYRAVYFVQLQMFFKARANLL